MKFGIIIQDLDADQASELLEQLTSTNESSNGVIVTVQGCGSGCGGGGNLGEFDSAGKPWDERIHASTKSKNADGRWKKKKGVDQALVAEIEGSAPVSMSDKLARAESAVGLGNVPAPPVTYAAHVAAPPVVSAPVPVAASVPSPVAAPVAAPVAPSRDFKGLMQQLSNLFASKKIDPAYPNTIVARINGGFNVQVATLTDIANEPRYVEYAWQCLDVDGNGLVAKAA